MKFFREKPVTNSQNTQTKQPHKESSHSSFTLHSLKKLLHQFGMEIKKSVVMYLLAIYGGAQTHLLLRIES